MLELNKIFKWIHITTSFMLNLKNKQKTHDTTRNKTNKQKEIFQL